MTTTSVFTACLALTNMFRLASSANAPLPACRMYTSDAEAFAEHPAGWTRTQLWLSQVKN